jgi:geranylgeranyl reductase family protein
MRIAIVGGGPAGCRAAALLAARGHEVVLFDAVGPWEKPCGGGVTAKAMALLDPDAVDAVPHCRAERLSLYFGGRFADVVLAEALSIFSRRELGNYLLDSARAVGVRFVRDRVVRLERRGRVWVIRTRAETRETVSADFVVGADGATSFVRRTLGKPLSSADLLATAGYFVPYRGASRMAIYFRRDLDGYMWSFPRTDHVSFGLIVRPETGWATRARAMLEVAINADLGAAAFKDAAFYSAPVPCLRSRTWATNEIAGAGWALVGDAAGLVDPITGEGIYYALRSAALLAESLPDSGAYGRVVTEECFRELARAARMYRRFYGGSFLGRDFRERMVQLVAASPTLRGVVGDLVAGTQGYRGLKPRLVRSAPRVGLDLARRAIGLEEKPPAQ